MHWQAAEIVKGSTVRLLSAAASPAAQHLAVADHDNVWRRLALLATAMQIAMWRLRGTGEIAVGTQTALWREVSGGLSTAITACEVATEHVADTRAILRQELGREQRPAPAEGAAPEPPALLAAASQAVDDTDLFNSIPDDEGSTDLPGYYATVWSMAESLRGLGVFCWVEGELVAEVYTGFGVRRRRTRTRRAMQATGRQWRRAAIGLDDALFALGNEWLGIAGSADGREP